jgi:excisionase family DNA binding protein
MAGAAGSAVIAPLPALESYISRWEAGNVAISARYQQFLDAVLGPGAEASAPQSPYGPTPDPRKWVQAMHALTSDIASETFRPGSQLPVRTVLARRYGLTVDAVIRAQYELLRTGVLSSGQVYGALYVNQEPGRQVPGAPFETPPDPAGHGRYTAVIPPGRAGRCEDGTTRAARDPRGYSRLDTSVSPPRTGAGARPSEVPARRLAGKPPPVDEPPELLLVKECAAQARVSPRTIYNLVRHGDLEAIKVGRDIRIRARSWHAYLHAPSQDLCPSPQPDRGGPRNGPPVARTPPAGPRPGPARSSHAGAPLAVFRAPL